MDVPVLPMGTARVPEAESIAILAPTQGDGKGLIRKVALLEGELVEARWARGVARERVHHLSNSSTEGVRWLLGAKSSLRSFPFSGLGALSGAFPSLAHHR
jgi:hypothetical protein